MQAVPELSAAPVGPAIHSWVSPIKVGRESALTGSPTVVVAGPQSQFSRHTRLHSHNRQQMCHSPLAKGFVERDAQE